MTGDNAGLDVSPEALTADYRRFACKTGDLGELEDLLDDFRMDLSGRSLKWSQALPVLFHIKRKIEMARKKLAGVASECELI